MQLVLGGRGIPGLVLSDGARVHPTLLVHYSRAVPGPCRVGCTTGTQLVGRAGEYSGCGGVMWCDVAWCGVVWCGPGRGGVADKKNALLMYSLH